MLCLGGSTSLWEANPRAMELALRLHDATIRQVLAKHSGYEAQISKRASQVAYALGSSELKGLGWQVTTEGDAFQIAFHDTADAVAFCLDTQAELLRCDWPDATLSHPDAAVPDPAKAENAQVVMMWVSPGLMALHHSWQPRPVVMEPGVDCVCAWVCTPAGRPLSPSTRLGGAGGRWAFLQGSCLKLQLSCSWQVTGRTRYAGPSVAMAKAIEAMRSEASTDFDGMNLPQVHV